MAVVGAETAFGDGRRVGCSTMVVTEEEVSVVFSLRRWPDDQSEGQLRWQLVDSQSGRTLTPFGGGYGGGAKPDEPRDLDGSWRFSGSVSDRVQLICSLGDREILNLGVPIISAPTSSHHLVVRSAQHRPPASERELFVQVRSRWPPERAAADRIEIPASSIDLSDQGMEIIAIEHWAGVPVLLARFPAEERHAGIEGSPVWWQMNIDGIDTNAVLFSSATGASGLLAWLVLADNMSPGTSTAETTH